MAVVEDYMMTELMVWLIALGIFGLSIIHVENYCDRYLDSYYSSNCDVVLYFMIAIISLIGCRMLVFIVITLLQVPKRHATWVREAFDSQT